MGRGSDFGEPVIVHDLQSDEMAAFNGMAGRLKGYDAVFQVWSVILSNGEERSIPTQNLRVVREPYRKADMEGISDEDKPAEVPRPDRRRRASEFKQAMMCQI